MVKNSPKLQNEVPISFSVRFLAPEKPQSYIVAAQQNGKDRGRGWAIDASNRQIGFRFIGDNGQGIEARAADASALVPGTWNELVATYDGSRNQTGMVLYLNGKPEMLAGLGARTAKLNGSIETDESIVLGKSSRGRRHL
ncbi:MAG: LamG-like jellyroll fold domain-containing protein [Ignavibacteriota bacterium]